MRELILVVSANVALADAYVVTPEDPSRNWFAQHFRCGRWHTLAQKHKSLIDQNPEQPTAKLAFMLKPLRMTRSYAPTTSYGFFRAFRTAEDTTCNEMKHPVAAPEPSIKDQLLLIEPRSFREVRPRVTIEIGINFAVRHAFETSAYGEEHPLKKCDISEVVINVAAIVLMVLSRWSYRRGF